MGDRRWIPLTSLGPLLSPFGPRWVVTVVTVLAAGLAPAWTETGSPPAQLAASGDCTCAVALETNGWCEVHQLGYVGSVKIRSHRLYEALDAHGHVVDLDSFECPACRRAIATEGFCEEHRIGFVDGQAYFSRLTYHLAKGEKRRPSDISCPTCRKNAGSHGWCDKCRVGMVGNVAIKDRGDYDEVARALAQLHAANEAAERCEICATAIALDGYCPECKVYYKDGKPVPPPQ